MRNSLTNHRVFFMATALLSVCGIPCFLLAHQGHHKLASSESSGVKQQVLAQINDSYLKAIQPIFEKSCFDCHSQSPRYPWYASLPVAKQLIAHDIKEAKTHLDMSHGFPFKGHGGAPDEDLQAIQDVIEEGSMPPLRYQALHWSAHLKGNEKASILEWIKASRSLLQGK